MFPKDKLMFEIEKSGFNKSDQCHIVPVFTKIAPVFDQSMKQNSSIL